MKWRLTVRSVHRCLPIMAAGEGAIFDFPQGMTFQRMDGSTAGYGTDFKTAGKIALTKVRPTRNGRAVSTSNAKLPDQLTLDGSMGGHKNSHAIETRGPSEIPIGQPWPSTGFRNTLLIVE